MIMTRDAGKKMTKKSTRKKSNTTPFVKEKIKGNYMSLTFSICDGQINFPLFLTNSSK